MNKKQFREGLTAEQFMYYLDVKTAVLECVNSKMTRENLSEMNDLWKDIFNTFNEFDNNLNIGYEQ